MSHAEILNDFPDLTEEDIRACLAFAADRESDLRVVLCNMELLFDQNLSHRLVTLLAEEFPGFGSRSRSGAGCRR